MASRIEDDALIGAAALVGRDGSIDWQCFPRFDSGACFAGSSAPPSTAADSDGGVKQVRRRYRPGFGLTWHLSHEPIPEECDVAAAILDTTEGGRRGPRGWRSTAR